MIETTRSKERERFKLPFSHMKCNIAGMKKGGINVTTTAAAGSCEDEGTLVAVEGSGQTLSDTRQGEGAAVEKTRTTTREKKAEEMVNKNKIIQEALADHKAGLFKFRRQCAEAFGLCETTLRRASNSEDYVCKLVNVGGSFTSSFAH